MTPERTPRARRDTRLESLDRSGPAAAGSGPCPPTLGTARGRPPARSEPRRDSDPRRPPDATRRLTPPRGRRKARLLPAARRGARPATPTAAAARRRRARNPAPTPPSRAGSRPGNPGAAGRPGRGVAPQPPPPPAPQAATGRPGRRHRIAAATRTLEAAGRRRGEPEARVCGGGIAPARKARPGRAIGPSCARRGGGGGGGGGGGVTGRRGGRSRDGRSSPGPCAGGCGMRVRDEGAGGGAFKRGGVRECARVRASTLVWQRASVRAPPLPLPPALPRRPVAAHRP
jgi:hypothetical protein